MPRLQPGDVPGAVADVSELQTIVGYKPRVTVEGGVRKFVDLYRGYNGGLQTMRLDGPEAARVNAFPYNRKW